MDVIAGKTSKTLVLPWFWGIESRVRSELSSRLWYDGSSCLKIWQSSIWYAGSLGRLSHGPSIWWSKYYFDRLNIKQRVTGLHWEHSNFFISIFIKLWENWKYFRKEFCKKLWKKIILGTSDDNRPMVLATHRIILKIVGFQNFWWGPCALHCK
jgi:hypothetical protein